jgi:hypothetical protein
MKTRKIDIRFVQGAQKKVQENIKQLKTLSLPLHLTGFYLPLKATHVLYFFLLCFQARTL